MARKNEQVFSTFIKGLMTEANPLTYPENSSFEEENFVLNRDGSRSRRLGVDYEELFSITNTGFTTAQIKEGKQSFHRWDSPGGSTSVSIGVIRILNKLWLCDLLTANPSANLLNSTASITISVLSNADIETTTINNKLIIVSDDLANPVKLTYDPSTDTVTQETITLYVRDIWGVDDNLEPGIRPTSLTQAHKYNLRNQGWSESIVVKGGGDAISKTFTDIGGYPSNADQWTLGKISNPSDADYESYDPETMEKNSTSKYQSPKGSFIIDAFYRGSDRVGLSDATGLPTDQENGSITTVASYAQRVFYSGISSNVINGDDRSPNYSGYIFFSKVVQSDDDLGKCYQEADPTDPSINDLIDSDGGSIQLPEASRIVKIVSSQSSLLVFAENGIWEIYGDTGGFIATSFQASKISTNGVFNAKSIVNVNGNFIYWSKAGIYLLSPDSAAGRFSAQSISLNTIQSLFLDIPELGKNHCKGYYDEKENRVRWLYNDTDTYSETNYINKYNKELILDLTLQAWTLNSISDLAGTSPFVCDYVDIPGYAVTSTDNTVLASTDPVIVTSTDAVIVSSDIQVNRSSVFSFLTIVGESFTISKYSSTEFLDWVTADATGADYSSFLVTGYNVFGDIKRDKQVPYVYFYFLKTEDGYKLSGTDLVHTSPSSCLVQAQWNWANSANSGKWGTQFQAYRFTRFYTPLDLSDTFDNGDKVVVTKNKLRGSGKSLSLKIESEAGKDMRLLGWAVSVTAPDVM